MADPIAFVDLKAQQARIRPALDARIAKVLDHAGFIMGPEVAELEAKLAAFAGKKYCLSCSNGTDSLGLALMAWGIGPGDAVFVPAFTFVASAEVVAWVGATPVFVDVERHSFNMDPASLERGIAWAKANGLRPRVVMPVDMFGLPADYPRLLPIARAAGLLVLSDSAQGFGGQIDGRPAASYAAVTSTSFFPAKPLGCYGDGGALFTNDEAELALWKSLRVHGQGSDKYDNVRIGLNARLDTLQAAILLEKLEVFPDEIAARNRVAQRYAEALADIAEVPQVGCRVTSVWAQYTLILPERAKVQAACKAAGVPTMVYYPIPLSRQTAYAHYPSAPGGVPVAETLAEQVLSLPMHPYLDETTQDRIIATVRAAVTA